MAQESEKWNKLLINIVYAGVLHGALLAVLHRGVRRRDGAGAAGGGAGGAAPPDHVLALAVYLLTVAADLATPHQAHDV